METTFFEKILADNAFEFAYLNGELEIVDHSEKLQRFAVHGKRLKQQKIAKAFPETVGLETLLADIAGDRHGTFLLEDIQRSDSLYFNMSFYCTNKRETPLLCLVQDVTEKAQLKQLLRQKENEILLLESLLSAQKSDATVALLGQSPAIERVRQIIHKIADLPTTAVLLTGESGTGKSMVARVIHYAAKGKNRPFVEINCAAIPESLLESEVFGYEKGAFTNALTGKPGLLEAADGGTLFLDEISEMSPKLQAKLLSFLETRRFRRLGSLKEQEVRVRLVAATNRKLPEMVENGDFREDLFYRLNVVNIELPSLGELGDDVLLLAEHFVKIFNVEFRKQVKGFTSAAKSVLKNHRWPGNVRELRNVIERSMIFAESPRIDAEDLHIGQKSPTAGNTGEPVDYFRLPAEGISFEEVERKLLTDALALTNGNQTQAARLLRLSRDAFRYRLEKHNLL